MGAGGFEGYEGGEGGEGEERCKEEVGGAESDPVAVADQVLFVDAKWTGEVMGLDTGEDLSGGEVPEVFVLWSFGGKIVICGNRDVAGVVEEVGVGVMVGAVGRECVGGFGGGAELYGTDGILEGEKPEGG